MTERARKAAEHRDAKRQKAMPPEGAVPRRPARRRRGPWRVETRTPYCWWSNKHHKRIVGRHWGKWREWTWRGYATKEVAEAVMLTAKESRKWWDARFGSGRRQWRVVNSEEIDR